MRRPARIPRLTLALAALCLSATAGASPQHRYTVDATQSDVSARVGFFGLAHKTARFPEVTGSIALQPADPSAIDLDVTIDARALRAGDPVTLERLRGPKFFDVARYPSVRFVGRTMRLTGPRTAAVAGELTARGVTRPVTLDVTFERPPAEADGTRPIALAGRTEIDRREFGMTAWSMIVGNRVTIELRARLLPT